MRLLLLLHAIFASTYTLGKMSLVYVSPVLSVAIRMIISALLLFALRLYSGQSFHIKSKDILLFLGLAFFLFYSYVPEFMVLPYLDTTKWALIYTLTPFCTALISYFHKSEHLTGLKIVGLLIGFFGIIPVLVLGNDTNAQDVFWHISWPEIITILCMISYSYGWVLANRLIKSKKYDAILVNGVCMMLGGLGALITSPFVEQWKTFPMSSLWPFVGVMTLLVLATTLAFTVKTYLLRYYTVTFLMFLMFVDPLYVALYGRLFLHEQVQWYFFASVFLVFIGLYLFYREELRHGYTFLP